MDAVQCALMFFVFAILFIHPILLYPASLMMIARFSGASRDGANSLSIARLDCGRKVSSELDATVANCRKNVSICVCAYNEAGVIRQKVENLFSLRRHRPDLQILVYVDGATDGTADILRDYERDLTLIVSSENTGKTVGMRRLVGMATGDVLVFSDANVMFASDAIDRMMERFDDSSVGCVCGRLVYQNREASSAANIGAGYWDFEENLKSLECQTGTTICADGSIFAVRRDLYPQVPDDIIEDFFVSLSILCSGFRIVCAPDAIAWEDSATSSADEFRRKVRISCQAFNVHRLIWPRLARQDALTIYKYVSHKLLRWLMPFHLVGAGLAGLGIMVHTLGWVPTACAAFVGLAGLVAGRAASFRPAAKATEVLSALAATGLGVVYSMRGHRFKTWKPVPSARLGAPVELEPAADASVLREGGRGKRAPVPHC